MARHLAAVRVAPLGDWWAAAWRRIVWTVLTTALVVAPGASLTTETLVVNLLTIALAALVALLTAVVALPEATGTRTPTWWAVLARTLRAVAHTALGAGIASATTLGDVNWNEMWPLLAGTVLVTVLRTGATMLGPLPSLPETVPAPIPQATTTTPAPE